MRRGLLLALLPVVAWAQSQGALDYRLQPREIAPGVQVIEGAVADFSRANGCNIINTGAIHTAEGTLLINTGVSRLYGQQQRQALAHLPPVRAVVHLNLHPDYFLGNQAWADVPTLALPGTRRGMQAMANTYEDNLYRLCGDWMLGTQADPARQDLQPGQALLPGAALHWQRLSGHTGDDLVLLEERSGVLFAGGLVFMNRVPTVPDAALADWMRSLQVLRQWVVQGRVRTVVPSHGPVHAGSQGMDQTLDWLQWLDQRLRDSAAQGLDLSEVLTLPIPPRFAHWAALAAEYARSVIYLYPRYETAQFSAQTVPTGTTP